MLTLVDILRSLTSPSCDLAGCRNPEEMKDACCGALDRAMQRSRWQAGGAWNHQSDQNLQHISERSSQILISLPRPCQRSFQGQLASRRVCRSYGRMKGLRCRCKIRICIRRSYCHLGLGHSTPCRLQDLSRRDPRSTPRVISHPWRQSYNC